MVVALVAVWAVQALVRVDVPVVLANVGKVARERASHALVFVLTVGGRFCSCY